MVNIAYLGMMRDSSNYSVSNVCGMLVKAHRQAGAEICAKHYNFDLSVR